MPSPLRRLRTLLRRRRRRAAVAPLTLCHSRSYGLALPGSPLDPMRGEKILGWLVSLGLVEADEVCEPPSASARQLLRVHTPAYLESLPDQRTLQRATGLALSAHQRDRFIEAQRRMVGGTVEAARRAWQGGGVAINLGGGLHHAHADRAQGFCLLNDVAVAIRTLRRDGCEARILVVDLDLHDGDGTRVLFADDPTVYTFSIHNLHWASPEAVASTAIELPGEVGDERYLATLRESLPPVWEAHDPGLVVFLAGTDPAADDRLGNWRLSPQGLRERDRLVWELAGHPTRRLRRGAPRRPPLPLVVLLAGGYGADTWRHTARSLGSFLAGEDLEPPATETALLQRYASLARSLDPAQLQGEATGDDWGLTEEDLFGSVRPRTSDSRFLGYYSLHGLELALEQQGILDRLRDAGYREPTLTVDLEPTAGHTLRIWGDRAQRDLLVEVRLRRDRRTLPDAELLAVEWLLLQNPRAAFPRGRPPLPGQRHPGLGLLEDAVALLLLVCRRLHLDGIVFTPSHYHLAVQSHRYLRFLDPADAARFAAIRRAVADLPLAQATRAVAAGEVWDAATGESVAWPAMPMVVPASEALARRLDGERDDAAVEEAARRLDYRWDPARGREAARAAAGLNRTPS
jgi:acetoin utilization deacetylase AcuC-like enzyme